MVGFGDHVGVVGVAAAREWRVYASAVRGAVYEEECCVDGAALAGVAGLRVPEVEVLGHVVGGEGDGACGSGDGDSAVGVDVGDGPVVAILDHEVPVGAESSVVAAGDHLVTDEHPRASDPVGRGVDVEFAGEDP